MNGSNLQPKLQRPWTCMGQIFQLPRSHQGLHQSHRARPWQRSLLAQSSLLLPKHGRSRFSSLRFWQSCKFRSPKPNHLFESRSDQEKIRDVRRGDRGLFEWNPPWILEQNQSAELLSLLLCEDMQVWRGNSGLLVCPWDRLLEHSCAS